MSKIFTALFILLPLVAAAQTGPVPVMIERNGTLVGGSTNLMRSNMIAGANITFTYGFRGQVTIDSSGGGAVDFSIVTSSTNFVGLSNFVWGVSNLVALKLDTAVWSASWGALGTNGLTAKLDSNTWFNVWGKYSTNVIASTATNTIKYLTNLWGDVGRGFEGLTDGQVLKYHAASGTWTNAADAEGGGGPGGGIATINGLGTNTTLYGTTTLNAGALVLTPTNIPSAALVIVDGRIQNHWLRLEHDATILSSNIGVGQLPVQLSITNTGFTPTFPQYPADKWENRVVPAIPLGLSTILFYSPTNGVTNIALRGGSLTLVEGANITFTTNLSLQTLTVASTGGGGGGSGWAGYNAPATNAVFHSGDTNQTNIIVVQRIGQAVPMWAARGSNGTLLAYWDNAGYLVLTNLPAPNFLPTTNSLAIGARSYGRLVPAWTDHDSNSVPVQGALWGTRVAAWWLPTAVQNMWTIMGSGPATNAGGTGVMPFAPDEVFPRTFEFGTGSGSNNSRSAFTGEAIAFSGTRRGANGYFFSCELIVTNRVHYGGGGGAFFFGLSDIAASTGTNMTAATNFASTRYAGFAVHGELGGGAATNWHFITKDNSGGNESRFDTGIPLMSWSLCRGYIYCPPQGRTLSVRLDDLSRNVSTNFWITASVPTNAMRAGFSLTTKTNVFMNLRVAHLYVEAPLAP